MRAFLVLFCLSVLTIPSHVRALEFTPLGFLNGGSQSFAYGISADGTTVVGDSGNQGFRWTRENGMIGIGDGVTGATAVNEDGSVIVGSMVFSGENTKAFRWTEPTGPIELGGYPEARSFANDVSADGTVVIGWGQDIQFANVDAFRWSQQTGGMSLGRLSRNDEDEANSISGDGTTIVGIAIASSQQAFRWTEATGMVGLGQLSGQSFSVAHATDNDGTTVVGSSAGIAIRWTAETGMVALEGVFSNSRANDINADGSIIVGAAGLEGEETIPFIWTEASNMQSIQSLLTAVGTDVTGWSLTEATAVSDDGMVVVGNGINPDGRNEAWLADLSGLPDEDPPDLPDKINPAILLILLRGSDDQFGEEEN